MCSFIKLSVHECVHFNVKLGFMVNFELVYGRYLKNNGTR